MRLRSSAFHPAFSLMALVVLSLITETFSDQLQADKDKVFVSSALGFWHAFAASISVILVSEIGDRTFFITAILAMQYSRWSVFAGTLTASFSTTVLSATLGVAAQIIPRKFTYYASIILFLVFGLKMLKEGWAMSPAEEEEEYEEAMEDIEKREKKLEKQKLKQETNGVLEQFVSKAFIEAFTLTFLAEWGDRSQLATIILAARENMISVILGGTLGHAISIAIAVLGGRILAQRISVRTVTLIGGVVFLLFALSALIITPDYS